MKPRDLSGLKFGRLTVVAYAGTHPANPKVRLWECVCDCGGTVTVRQGNVVSGNTTSCGCFQKQRIKETAHSRTRALITHGWGNTPTYKSWWAMNDRCFNTKHHAYPVYGGAGIIPCEFLQLSPQGIVAVIGERPNRNLTLDRIDSKLGYWCGQCAECVANSRPLNIRWATWRQQGGNRNNNVYYKIDGRSQIGPDWALELGMNISTFRRKYSANKVTCQIS